MLTIKNHIVNDTRHVVISGDDATQLRAAFEAIKAKTKQYRTQERMIIVDGQGAGAAIDWLNWRRSFPPLPAALSRLQATSA